MAAQTLPPVTCGIIVRSPQGWLLGRVCRHGHWDLPKGKMDPGESKIDAALRECREETGLDLSAYRAQLVDLGERSYNKKRGKRLHLFELGLPEALSLEACHCSSWVQRRGVAMPEMDAWAWVDPQHVAALVKPRMAKHLRKRGLLPQPLAATAKPHLRTTSPRLG